ncbi:MAG: ATP-binding protein [Vicinamibacterales bacterium]
MEPPELDRLTKELSLRKRLQDALLVFSRSLSARLTLDTALESLSMEVTALFGVRRTSIWIHDRDARTLSLAASSDPREIAGTPPIPTGTDSPIARGLRIDAPQVSGSGDAQSLIVSLRGWRRALGTLVIEGEPREVAHALFVDLSADLSRQLSMALERQVVLEERILAAEGQERLRDRLAQTEKLASLGEFVAGIAHQMNNPLQGVLGHLELLIDAPASAPVRSELQRIYNDADHARTIVQNMLTFTATGRAARQPIDVHDVVEQTMAMRRAARHRGDVEIVHRPGPDLPGVLGDAGQLQQALLNILINAEQAIAAAPGGGHVIVTTRAEGGLVTIEIRDSGPGIEPAVLARIFEPFFTTKPAGQGTGLGLAITQGIVQAHGGSITAASSPQGTVFTIALPAADDKVDAAGPPS